MMRPPREARPHGGRRAQDAMASGTAAAAREPSGRRPRPAPEGVEP